MKSWRVGLLGVGISLIAVIFIYQRINVAQLVEALRLARYGCVVPCVLLLLLALVPRALRWRVLLDGDMPLIHAFSIMNVAYLVNGVIPLRIGELARIYLATRLEHPIPVMKTTSTIITERLLDLLAVVVMALLALAVAPIPDSLRTTAFFMGPLALVGFGVMIMLATYRGVTERFIAVIMERFAIFERLHLDRLAAHFLDGLAPLTRPTALAAAIGLTGLSWMISASAGYVLMYAFYEQASWTTTFLYIAAAAFAIAVPAIPGNVGTYEAAILAALSATGYVTLSVSASFEVGLSFAVMVHTVNVVVHALTGIAGLLHEGISIQQLSHGVRQMQQVNREVQSG